jgi:hypothetical protein
MTTATASTWSALRNPTFRNLWIARLDLTGPNTYRLEHTYVERNQEFVPNYGERYRNGEKIASGFVESAINQVVSKRMVKKQQMDGASVERISSCRYGTRVLDEQWENNFRRWYPDFRLRWQAKKAV